MDTENQFCEHILTFKLKQFSEKNLINNVAAMSEIQVPDTKI